MEPIESTDQFKTDVMEYMDGVVVVNWTATWCGPCQRIKPAIQELATTDIAMEQKVRFRSVDVDKCQELAEAFQAVTLPTFMFFVQGKVVDQFSGANFKKLTETLQKLSLIVQPDTAL